MPGKGVTHYILNRQLQTVGVWMAQLSVRVPRRGVRGRRAVVAIGAETVCLSVHCLWRKLAVAAGYRQLVVGQTVCALSGLMQAGAHVRGSCNHLSVCL